MELRRALAQVQGGVVAREDLLRAGVASSSITLALRVGTLRPLAPGLYAANTEPELLRMGSALGCLSHRSAAQVLGLAVLGDHRRVDVVVEHRRRANPAWALLHRARLPRGDVCVVAGLRVTSAARTVVDLARSVPLPEAVVVADSALRTLLRLLLAGSGLRPRSQVSIEDVGRVDFLFEDERVVVEADGFAFHADRASFRTDRRRGNALQARGFRVLRFSWEDVRFRPEMVVTLVRRTLAQAG